MSFYTIIFLYDSNTLNVYPRLIFLVEIQRTLRNSITTEHINFS